MAFCLSPLRALADEGDPSTTSDDDGCEMISAPIVTTFFVEGCTSPFGLCTSGYVASGPLAGATLFSVFTVAPGDNPGDLLYTGGLFISAEGGDLSIQDSGLLSGADGTF